MADDTGQTRTEAPTPRRREEARKKGQTPLSTELAGAGTLLVGLIFLWFAAGQLGGQLTQLVRGELLQLERRELDPNDVSRLAWRVAEQGLTLAGPLLATVVLGAAVLSTVQTGLAVSTVPLSPDAGRLSLAKGLGRVLSLRSVIRGVWLLLKLLASLAVVAWLVRGRLADVTTAGRGTLLHAVQTGWTLSVTACLALAASWVLIGLGDCLFQRWRHDQDLRMSRQELKDEQRLEEGDPHVRGRIRSLQRQAAVRKMLDEVPKATVVLTNPTHVAVALRYERERMAAPKVVAKGAGHVAARIVRIAYRHNVPVLERKPLARALYQSVKIGQEIPVHLYRAIAEILAHVYRLGRR